MTYQKSLSVNVYLLQEQFCQISQRCHLKWQSLRLLEELCPTKNNNNKKKNTQMS